MNSNDPPLALLTELSLLDGPNGTTVQAIAWVALPSGLGGLEGLKGQDPLQYLALAAVTYLIVFACSGAIYLHLRRAFAASQGAGAIPISEQGSQRSAAWQINAILVIQATIPIVFDFLPTYAATTLLAVSGLANPQTSAFVIAFLAWAPSANAAAVILIVRPYRRALFKKRSDQAVSLENLRITNASMPTATQSESRRGRAVEVQIV